MLSRVQWDLTRIFMCLHLIGMRGRPKKPVEEYRSEVLRIRLNEPERLLIEDAADGKTSTWARDILLNAAKKKLLRDAKRN